MEMLPLHDLTGVPFSEMETAAEAGLVIGVKYKRVHALVEELRLPYRFATVEEEALLIAGGRIKGLPGTHPPGQRIKLIPRDVIRTIPGRYQRKR